MLGDLIFGGGVVIMIINSVLTVSEAAKKWGIVEGTIRAAIKSNKFVHGVDYRKAGKITLITKEAMLRVYSEPKANEYVNTN